jgi:putative peptidoglycan lipid II flippase
MSQVSANAIADAAAPSPADASSRAGGFVGHAKLIGFLTFISRVLGMARESVAANYFGAGPVWAAFTVAFTIPNLFRKLFGEGALSAAFIPLYAKAVREGSGLGVQGSALDVERSTLAVGRSESTEETANVQQSTSNVQQHDANAFAAASVNLLAGILILLTVIGELILLSIAWLVPMPPDRLLAIKLTAIMLPYVLLVCGTAFLGGILQVHRRFGPPAAAPILLNLCLIVAIVVASMLFDLRTEAGREAGVYWLAIAVLVAGVLQVAMLLPALRAVGFRFRLILHLWTPAIRKMLLLSFPVALAAGVLQLSVLLDKGIALFLAQSADGATHFTLWGHLIRYPMEAGAAARLNWAQYLYQFPLGIFAIALATAIFPKLSADALDTDREQFRRVLRRGIEAALFIGLPASAGLILVRYPAVRLLFERGNFTPDDTILVARAVLFYSAAIWAFSLQQIIIRGYYALHDMTTPLVLAIVTLIVNLCVELPLIWTGLGEAGMAAGTCMSFSVQAAVMVWLLSRKVGGIGLSGSIAPIAKMVLATAVMLAACLGIQMLPWYPTGGGSMSSLMQLLILMGTGGGVYLGMCMLLSAGIGLPLPGLRSRKRNG